LPLKGWSQVDPDNWTRSDGAFVSRDASFIGPRRVGQAKRRTANATERPWFASRPGGVYSTLERRGGGLRRWKSAIEAMLAVDEAWPIGTYDPQQRFDLSDPPGWLAE
jgi:hypothetical protein